MPASSWHRNNTSETGAATLHSYNENVEDDAEPPMGRIVDEKLNEIRV